MSHAVAATMLASLLLMTSCAADDESADTSSPASVTTRIGSETSVALPSTLAPTNHPTTGRVTTLAPSTTGPATTIESHFAPVPQAPPPNEPVSEGASSATELEAEQTCDPTSPTSPAVTLRWRPVSLGTQLAAVAVLPDGFETGRYAVTDELPPDRSWYGISPVQPGGVYYWRVLTRSNDRWVASDIAQFTGPTCILDTPSSP